MPNKTLYKSILSTIALVFFIICLVFASYQVNRITTDFCFSTLDDAVSQAANEIYEQMSSDTEQLNVIADLLTQHDDMNLEIVKRHLSAYHQRGLLSAIGILLPNNQFILGDDSEYGLVNDFDFENELDKIPYISGVITMPDNAEKKYIYQAIPVQKDGKSIGILYGFVGLDKLAENITSTAFDGNAQVYVADGETGDFLVDTWHKKLGNVFDKDIMNRKVKSGYDFLEMKRDFIEGKEGHIAFWSNTAGEYLYSYYMPIGINKWMVQLTVPESVVFASSIKIKRILYVLVIAETIMFLLYFVFALSKMRRDAKAKEEQLEQTRYVYDVQRTLFEAHKDYTQISAALQKVSKMLTAKYAFLMAMDGTFLSEIFSSSHSDKEWINYFKDNRLTQSFPYLFGRLAEGQNLLLYSKDLKALPSESDRKAIEQANISNLMVVPVFDYSNTLIGILGCVSMKKHWKDTGLLECVVRDFVMALRNIHYHRQIERLGIIDSMTGLKNRNCYEQTLDSYAEKCSNDSLCCLYMDVNGLHILNNTLGHSAGDEMLIYIANSIKKLFGTDDAYRIGGDEFVVLCEDCSTKKCKSGWLAC